MKPVARSLRTSSIAMSLVVSMTASSLTPQLSFAQTDSDTKEAKALFESGVSLYRNGKLEEARVKFKAAYALKRRPSIALNLANAELQTKRPLDAIAHYREVLAMADAKAEDREDAKTGITEARKQLGIVNVTPTTATVSVDGEARPLTEGSIEVIPGPHTVVLRVGDVETTEKVTLAAGQTISLRAKEKGTEAAPAIVPAAVPGGASSTSATPPDTSTAAPPTGDGTVVAKTEASATPAAEPPPPEPTPAPKRRKRVHPASYVGLGLTAVSAGLWITYAVLAKDAADQANAYGDLLRTRGICGEAPEGQPCNTLENRERIRSLGLEQKSNHESRSDVATVFGVTTAVLAVATGLSFIFLRRKAPKAQPTSGAVDSMPTLVFAPTQGGATFGLVGQF